MTLKETVNQLSGQTKIGIENYNPAHKTMPRTIMAVPENKDRRETFMFTIPKRKSHIPGPGNDQKVWDWRVKEPQKIQTMNKAAKVTYLGEIFKKG